MLPRTLTAAGGILCIFGLLAGCKRSAPVASESGMGEPVIVGPLTYNVIETNWKPQLGDGLNVRPAQQRFLIISLTAKNTGNAEVSMPLLELQSADGREYKELENGEGVDHWLGLIRTIAPGQTVQGDIAFDVPLASYKLRLTDGAGPGLEKYAWVTIPLRLDTDSNIVTPAPGV